MITFLQILIFYINRIVSFFDEPVHSFLKAPKTSENTPLNALSIQNAKFTAKFI